MMESWVSLLQNKFSLFLLHQLDWAIMANLKYIYNWFSCFQGYFYISIDFSLV